MRIDNNINMELVAFVPNHLLWACSSVLYNFVDFGYLLSGRKNSPTFYLFLVNLSKYPVGELMYLTLNFRDYSILDKCIFFFFLCKKREGEKRGGKAKRSYASYTYSPGGNNSRKFPLATTT